MHSDGLRGAVSVCALALCLWAAASARGQAGDVLYLPIVQQRWLYRELHGRLLVNGVPAPNEAIGLVDDRVSVSYAYTTTDANGEYNLISAPETVTSTPFSATLRYFSQGTDGGYYQVERRVADYAWPAPLELPDIAIDRIRILAPRGVDYIPCRTTYQWDIPASLSSETLSVEFEVGIRMIHGGWSLPYLSRDVTGLSRATIAVPCGSGANDFKPDEWYDWDIKASSSDGLVRIAYGEPVRFSGP